MNCMSCGAFLSSADLDYCPRCGSNVQVQRKVEYLSKLYYNQGLEKAEIRDLSGAITCLKTSLMFNKENIPARNLLGLVYFETGEVVAALSQWVISKNLQPSRNLASEYISRLQSNPGKLSAINDTIRKYNSSLALCREGHEDMAAIQLKKLLSQNSKLIKGYHLLALLQMKDHAWNKARRTLKKAARIDRTNTTTLRFLREIDEQTGVVTRLDGKSTKKTKEPLLEQEGITRGTVYRSGNDVIIQPPAYKERSMVSVFLTLGLGIAVGAAALWFFAVPSVRQGIYREANEQIMNYSDYLVSQEAELSQIKGTIQENDTSQDTEQIRQQLSAVQGRSNSYQALLAAYSAIQDNQLQLAAEYIQKVKPSTLSDTARAIYDNISKQTGASGSEELYSDGTAEDISQELAAAAQAEETAEDNQETGQYGGQDDTLTGQFWGDGTGNPEEDGMYDGGWNEDSYGSDFYGDYG